MRTRTCIGLTVLVLAGCTGEDRACDSPQQCARLMSDQIQAVLEVPQGGEQFGKLDVWVGMHEDGTAHTVQVMSSSEQKHLNEPFLAAVKAASPYSKLQPNLESDFDAYKRLKVSFYGSQAKRIYDGRAFDMRAARENSDFLHTLNQTDVVNIMGEPDERISCRGANGEAVSCWRYSGVRAGAQDDQPGDFYVAFRDGGFYAISSNFTDSGDSGPAVQYDNELPYQITDPDKAVEILGEPRWFVPHQSPNSFSLHYANEFIQGQNRYRGAVIFYDDGRFRTLSFVPNDS